jgi:lipid II:glycine glycyltransferase (peptidoglycan interpeptide bridge formation enzyme)
VTSLLAERNVKCRVANLLSDRARLQPAWDEFVGQHPKGSVFHSSHMVRVFDSAKGHTVLPLAAVTDSGEILALLVATRVKTLPNMFGAVSSRSIWYAEPLCYDTSESIDSLCELIAEHDRIFRRRVLFTEVRPLQSSGPERIALERCCYEYLDYLNYVVDTTRPKDELWKRMRDSARRSIRKCEQRSFQIRHVNTADGVEAIYDLLRLTYGRAEVPLASRSLFDAALKILQPQGMIELIALYEGEKPLAVSVLLPFNKQVFGWYGGSVRIQGVSPVDYLTWHEIAWSCDHGFERYDFGGAGWPNQPYGVRDFKAKFGGELVCYGRYRKVYSVWKMALAERAYQFGRKIISPK